MRRKVNFQTHCHRDGLFFSFFYYPEKSQTLPQSLHILISPLKLCMCRTRVADGCCSITHQTLGALWYLETRTWNHMWAHIITTINQSQVCIPNISGGDGENASSIWASRLVFVIQWKRDIIFLLSKDDCQSWDESNGVSLFQHQGVLIALLLLMAIHLLIQIVRFGVSVRPSEVIKSL